MAIENSKQRGSFDATLRWVGDLDHPFYNDERQRFVWYESSAIGFQLVVLLQFLIAGLTLLVVGSAALPYAAVAMAPVVVASLVVVGYAHRRGAQYWVQNSDLRRSRGIVATVIVLIWAAGMLRAQVDSPGWSSSDVLPTLLGAAFGGGIVLGVGYALTRRAKADADGDDVE